jgi:hypothetical protein
MIPTQRPDPAAMADMLSTHRRAIVAGIVAAAVVIVSAVAYFLASGPAPRPVPQPQAVPVPAASAPRAADAFLSHLDAGAYDNLFDEMAARFSTGEDRNQFVVSIGAVRTPLGKVRERTLHSESTAERNPDGRVGPFRVHQYLTTFDAGPRLEVLVMVAEGDSWRFYSYNVAPAP